MALAMCSRRVGRGGLLWRLQLCAALCFVVIICLPLIAQAKKKSSFARKEDIPFIKCQVCEELSQELVKKVTIKRVIEAPKKLSELKIIEITERVCDVKRQEGDWIQWFDLQERGSTLKLVKQLQVGECRSECKTIEKACRELLDSHDTDVAELLFVESNGLPQLRDKLCLSFTKACSTNPPPLPKDRKPGEAFEAKSKTEIERQQITRDMEAKHERLQEEFPNGPRMPKMKLYSRDDMLKEASRGVMGGEEEEEEEEEDEEEGEKGGERGGEFDMESELRALKRAMREAEAKKEENEKQSKMKDPPYAPRTVQAQLVSAAIDLTDTLEDMIDKYAPKAMEFKDRLQDMASQYVPKAMQELEKWGRGARENVDQWSKKASSFIASLLSKKEEHSDKSEL